MRTYINQLRHPVFTFALLMAGLAGCSHHGPDTTPLHDAAKTDNADQVRALLASNPGTIEIRNGDQETALIVAAKDGSAQAAKALIELGADPAAKDTYGYTPLHWAAYNGHPAVAELLVARHADTNARDKDQETALMLASKNGYADIVLLLLNHAADVNAVDNDRWTALEYAVKKNHGDIVKDLLAHGANPNTSDSETWTPLLYACDYGYLSIARDLVEMGSADVNARTKDGLSPIAEARKEGHPEVAQYLDSKGGH